MNFFDGIDTNSNEFDLGGGDILPIPKDTRVLATAEEAKNDSYENDSYINIKWRVNQPEEYANRVLFQKVKVFDADPAKAAKHKKMLAAIATNAGGRLFAAMQQASEQTPSDNSLTALTNAPMVLLLDEWDMNGKQGNWVKSVSARKGAAPAPAPTPAPQQQPATAPAADEFDDDIPF